jgi:hypothetical protein
MTQPYDSLGNQVVGVNEVWLVTGTKDQNANDSNKTFTVPDGQEWQILFRRVALTTTATVGNRQLDILFLDSDSDTIGEVIPGVTQAASLGYNYTFGQGMPDMTAVRDSTYLSTPLPAGLILQAGDKIQVYDNNAVDAAADDMSVYIQYAYRQV